MLFHVAGEVEFGLDFHCRTGLYSMRPSAHQISRGRAGVTSFHASMMPEFHMEIGDWRMEISYASYSD